MSECFHRTPKSSSCKHIAFGTVRVSVNLIEGWGFKGSGGGSSGKGGKGLGSSGGKKGSNANYSVDVAFALCQGPVNFTGAPNGFLNGSTLENRVWANGSVAG